MNKLRYLSLTVFSLFGICAGHATTVIPPTFDQLVSRAQVIFQGAVTDVRSQWAGEGAQRHIVTFVTFKVEDTLKGNAGATYSIRLLGGTVDGETMEVSDTPKFKVGDRDILWKLRVTRMVGLARKCRRGSIGKSSRTANSSSQLR